MWIPPHGLLLCVEHAIARAIVPFLVGPRLQFLQGQFSRFEAYVESSGDEVCQSTFQGINETTISLSRDFDVFDGYKSICVDEVVPNHAT